MRATKALIHLQNLRHNLKIIKTQAQGAKICLAVKANAYGHGAREIAKTAIDEGVSALGVATAGEAIALREVLPETPILLYGLASPGELEELASRDVEFFVGDREYIEVLRSLARNKQIAVHLKIDTGMGRIGCRPEEAAGLAEIISRQSEGRLRLAGVCTHFPLSDAADTGYTVDQTSRFSSAVAAIRARGIDPGIVHAANSAGVERIAAARFDMVRPGISAYGYGPALPGSPESGLKPVMELRTAITFIKRVPAGTPISYGHRYRTSEDSWIATVPIGYADGLPRLASGKIAFRGVESPYLSFPQVGTICMDQCMINLGPGTAPPAASRWEELVVFGPRPDSTVANRKNVAIGGSALVGESAADIAAKIGTISYEILSNISARVPRVYVD